MKYMLNGFTIRMDFTFLHLGDGKQISVFLCDVPNEGEEEGKNPLLYVGYRYRSLPDAGCPSGCRSIDLIPSCTDRSHYVPTGRVFDRDASWL